MQNTTVQHLTSDADLDALLAQIRGGLDGHTLTDAMCKVATVAHQRGRDAERRSLAGSRA